jgi:hypothetical protein
VPSVDWQQHGINDKTLLLSPIFIFTKGVTPHPLLLLSLLAILLLSRQKVFIIVIPCPTAIPCCFLILLLLRLPSSSRHSTSCPIIIQLPPFGPVLVLCSLVRPLILFPALLRTIPITVFPLPPPAFPTTRVTVLALLHGLRIFCRFIPMLCWAPCRTRLLQGYPLVLAKEHCASCTCRQQPSTQHGPCLHLLPHGKLLRGQLLRHHAAIAASVRVVVRPEFVTHLNVQEEGSK